MMPYHIKQPHHQHNEDIYSMISDRWPEVQHTYIHTDTHTHIYKKTCVKFHVTVRQPVSTKLCTQIEGIEQFCVPWNFYGSDP